MYLKSILVFIILLNNVINVKGESIIKCEKQILNLNKNNNIIEDTVLDNLTYILHYFNNDVNKKDYKNGFNFVTPIENNNNTYGIGFVYIKSLYTTLKSLNEGIDKIKKNCINNEYLKGNYDDGRNIKICYDLNKLYSNNITKTICDYEPNWF